MTHPNDMSAWPKIACQRGHDTHATRQVRVKLGGPTPYFDLAPIPSRFAREFDMLIWDPDRYPVDSAGVYCPAHDAVSETIATHGVWEVRETILTLAVCSGGHDAIMIDFGSQIGWFSLLAASCGMLVRAFDADTEDVRILDASAALNGWEDAIYCDQYRVGPDSPTLPPYPVRLAKIDIEGAEDQAIRVLWPSIEAGLVDHLLIEVSPVFADYYPDLVADLLDAGYDAYLLPEKGIPPARLSVFPDDLAPWQLNPATARETVASWRQENVWFCRRGASW